MRIFVNGDSHTSGSELYFPTQDAYPYQLAKLLNGEIIGNPAIGGASNDRILRTTEEYLRECERTNEYPDLIVIGWSEAGRTDWFVDGVYESIHSQNLTPERTTKIDPARAKFCIDIWRQPELVCTMARYFHERMYNLHQHLDYLKIPHLFFMAVNPLKVDLHRHNLIMHETFDTSIIEYDWNGCFWNPYEDDDGSFRTWGLKKGYPITKWHHLNEDAHTDFAQTLYQYINTRIF
jgi:hypothetical protein